MFSVAYDKSEMEATINLANNSQKLLTRPWPRAMHSVNHSYFSFSNVGSYVCTHTYDVAKPFMFCKNHFHVILFYRYKRLFIN